METKPKVLDFLLSVDPKQSILSFAEILVTTAKKDAVSEKIIAQAIDSIHYHLTNKEKPFISEKGMKEFRKVKTRSSGYTINGVPDYYNTIVSVLYLKTKSVFAAGQANFINNLQEKLKEVPEKIKKLPADFFDDLLVESEYRASKYPSFAYTLNEALKEISEQKRNAEPIKDLAIPVLLRRNDGDEPACVITVHDSQGNVSVVPIDDWWICLLIFLGFILMIILTI